jgi:hypothetical protein
MEMTPTWTNNKFDYTDILKLEKGKKSLIFF